MEPLDTSIHPGSLERFVSTHFLAFEKTSKSKEINKIIQNYHLQKMKPFKKNRRSRIHEVLKSVVMWERIFFNNPHVAKNLLRMFVNVETCN